MCRNPKNGNALIAFCFIVLIISIGLNVLLIRSRRSTQPLDNSPRRMSSTQTVYLREIAQSLGIQVPDERSASDLASDIRIALDEARIEAVQPMSKDSIAGMEAVLGPKDFDTVRRLNGFVQSLEGKRVLVLPSRERISR